MPGKPAGEIRQGREAANKRYVIMQVIAACKGSWILLDPAGAFYEPVWNTYLKAIPPKKLASSLSTDS